METTIANTNNTTNNTTKSASSGPTRAQIDMDESSSVLVSAQLMQNYVQSLPFAASTDISAALTSDNRVETFTLGTDGFIYKLYQDPSSDTGYGALSTGIASGAFGAGFTATGVVGLVYVDRGIVNTAFGKPGNDRVRPHPISVPCSPTAKVDVATRNINGQFFASVTFLENGVVTWFASAIDTSTRWPSPSYAPPTHVNNAKTVLAYSPDGSGSVSSYLFVNEGQILVGRVPNSAPSTPPPRFTGPMRDPASGRTPSGLTISSITAIERESPALPVFFAILSDGGLYVLDVAKNGGSWSNWVRLSDEGLKLHDIAAGVSAKGKLEAFSVDESGTLYHVEEDASAATGWSDADPIARDVGRVGTVQGASGATEIFYSSSSTGQLWRVRQDPAGSAWIPMPIAVVTGGAMRSFSSYTMELSVVDDVGTARPNVPVRLWATEPTVANVNGNTYVLDADVPLSTSSNGSGVVSIALATSSLRCPSFKVLVGDAGPASMIDVQPSYEVQQRLATATANDLMKATDGSGNTLLSGSYRTDDIANGLASILNQGMTLTGGGAQHVGTKSLVGTSAGGAAYWSFDVTHKDDPRFVSSTTPLAQSASAPTNVPKRKRGWSFRDFISAVKRGVAEIKNVTARVVGNGLQIAYQFVINNVAHAFDAVISTVEEAFDMAESLFAMVKVYFKQIFEWLAMMFNWPDIIRTKKAIAWSIQQTVAALPGFAGSLRNTLDSGMDTVIASVRSSLSALQASGPGQQTLMTVTRAPATSSHLYKSASNNVVYTGFVNNYQKASGPSISTDGASNAISTFVNTLTAAAANSQADSNFQRTLAYFEQLATELPSDANRILELTIAGVASLLESLTELTVETIRQIVDAAIAAADSIVDFIQDTLAAKWKIPFLSDLYEFVTGGGLVLSVLDVVSWILAVPTTLMYKLTYGAAPFASDDAEKDFERAFTSSAMLAAIGVTQTKSTSGQNSLDDFQEMMAPYARVFPVLAAFAKIIGGLVTAVADGIGATALNDPNKQGKGTGLALSALAYGINVIAIAGTFPWIASDASPNLSTPQGWSGVSWLVSAVFDGLVDGAIMASQFRVRDTWTNAGTVLSMLGSAMTAGLAIAAVDQQRNTHHNPWVAGTDIGINLLDCSVFLRFSEIADNPESGPVARGVLAGLDVVSGVASGAITATQVIMNN